ncbi:hypothetical protein [Paraburkholderia silvatlantica]|uniref:Uncharacterized protein n=2 Tax=Paraburkholderia silvatlantica TaxID=321895 RepID=A0ABR6FFY0_9BURK|nr:hypothetical protein [Paraburkholderia silvatlantica]MBB2926306.1 hypothetical protein [Paraburkholderia silvatlantica]
MSIDSSSRINGGKKILKKGAAMCRRYLVAAAFLIPALSQAFQPVAIPECRAADPDASVQETIDAAKCRARWLLAGAYNRTEGDAMSAVSECAGTFDEVLNHRLTEGVSHDELVVMCADTAMHMGIMKLD